MIRLALLLTLLISAVPAESPTPTHFMIQIEHPHAHASIAKHRVTHRHKVVKLTVRQVIVRALKITHHPIAWVRPLTWLAWQESKDHAHAQDSIIVYNADIRGDSERASGLFQVLPTTFDAHALPHMRNIWNPVDNAVASIRYIVGRYGTPTRIPGIESNQYRGY